MFWNEAQFHIGNSEDKTFPLSLQEKKQKFFNATHLVKLYRETSNRMAVSSDIFWKWGINSEIHSWQVKEA